MRAMRRSSVTPIPVARAIVSHRRAQTAAARPPRHRTRAATVRCRTTATRLPALSRPLPGRPSPARPPTARLPPDPPSSARSPPVAQSSPASRSILRRTRLLSARRPRIGRMLGTVTSSGKSPPVASAVPRALPASSGMKARWRPLGHTSRAAAATARRATAPARPVRRARRARGTFKDGRAGAMPSSMAQAACGGPCSPRPPGRPVSGGEDSDRGRRRSLGRPPDEAAAPAVARGAA